MDIYITEKESGTRIALSMLPEKVKRKASTKFQSYDIINIGEVKLPRGTKLLTFSWDGTFPGSGRKSYGFIKSHFWMEPKELEAISSVLLARERTARDLILKACPDRIHTILPGILLMGMVCQFLGSKNIYVSQFGVREGYLCRKLIISGNSVIPKTVS